MAIAAGNISGSTLTGSLSYTNLINVPVGIVSSSTQLPAGIVSSSAQVIPFLPIGTVSSSAQINTGSFSGSFVGVATTASYALTSAGVAATAISASYAGTASVAISASYAANAASGLSGGTTNYIPLWTSATAQSSSNLYQSSGNIGIATTSPQTKLNINVGDGGSNGIAGLRIGGTSNYESLELGIIGSYGGMIRSYGNDLNYYAGHWKTVGSSATEDHSHYWYTSKNGSTNWSTAKMRLDHDGNLGIGITSPAYNLDVNGIGATTVRIRGSSNGYTQGALLVQSATTDSPEGRGLGIYLFNEGTDKTWFFGNGYAYGDAFVINRKSGTSFDVSAAAPNESSNYFIINSSGNVGIGTTSPAAALHVAGAISATPTGVGVLMGLQNNYGNIHLNGVNGGYIDFSNDTGTDFVGRIINFNSDKSMLFYTNGNFAMAISGSGNVGIGTNSPGALLHVQGAVSASSYTANGNAVWHAGNDGASSGLDADLLDGQHGSYYTTAGNLSGTIPSSVLGNSTLYVGTTAIALNRSSTSQTLTGVSIDGNAVTVSNLTAVQFFNNMGQNHSTRTSFDASAASYDYGFRYVQGSTNGPGTGGTQFYSLYIGLGNDYPSIGAGSYGMYMAIDRNVTTPYLSIRYNENNSLSAWRKIAAGYADSAGTATTLATARNINGVSFNGSADITISRLYTYDDRIKAPSDDSAGYVTFGFTSWANNNTSPYADYLHLRSYSDSSGGNDNLLMFRKDALGMRLWQQSFGSGTAYSSYKDVAWTDGTNASGTWSISISGNAANITAYTINQNVGTANSPSFAGLTVDTNTLFVDATNDRVGIGTTSPSYKLHVVGTTNVTGLIYGNGKEIFNTGDSYLRINQSGDFSAGLWLASSNMAVGTAYWSLGSNGGTTTSRIYMYGGTYDGNNVIYLDGSTGIIRATGDMRAPIFYDSVNTSYYLDPNSTSTSLYVRGVIQNPSVWINNGDNYNSYNENIRLFSATNGASVIAFSATGTSGTPTTSIIGWGDKLEIRFGDAWKEQIYSGYVVAADSYRAPIFYDSNDTNYYVNPAGTSVLNQINLGLLYGDISAASSNNSSTSYSVASIELREAQLGGNSGYLAPRLGFHWGGVVASQLSIESSGRISVLDNPGSGYESLIGSILYGNSSVRAPIFYYTSDTSIYMGYNSSSTYTQWRIGGSKNSYGGIYDVYSAVNGFMYDSSGNGGVYREANGRWYLYYHLSNDCLGVGTSSTSSTYSLYLTKGVYAQARIDATIFYDTDNTGYYTDPSSTSYIYQLGVAYRVGIGTSSPSYDLHIAKAASPSIYLDSGNDDSKIYFTATSKYIVGLPAEAMAIYTTSNIRVRWDTYGERVYGALGVGSTPDSGWTAGEIRATNNITAYYSDERLKTFLGTIPNALEKVQSLSGYYFIENEVAKALGYNNDAQQVGVSAQEVQQVLPEAVAPAPISDKYLTVRYEKLVPLLIEAIKELNKKIKQFEGK